MTKSVFRGLTLFLAGAMTAAVLAQAAQQTPKDSKAAPANAASSAAATAAAAQNATDNKAKGSPSAGAASPTQKPADPAAVLLRDAANAGFRPEHIRGNLMFCRTTTEVGSRFPVRTCYDEDHVKIKIQEYQTQRNEMQAHRGFPQLCNPPGGAAASAPTC